jgi:carboxyl-terminal processing protease
MSPTQVFARHADFIRENYARPVTAKDLRYAAMEGLLSAVGDPHTVFLEPVAAKSFAQDTEGNFVGVGARLAPDPMGAKVMTVFKDGPAFKAGLKDGDLITGVDDKAVGGMDTDDIVSMIRGRENTLVRLRIVRAGEPRPITLNIRRGVVIPPTVEGRVLEGANAGYISVSQFSKTTTEQFETVMTDLVGKKVDGLVVDLRNNPGGLLETAVEMLSNFVSDKVVVKMRFRNGREEVARTEAGRARRIAFPVVVLVNEDSASAAEIFAGVLRDYRLATLVGTHTYGKASVQNVFPLVDGSSAKITIARYYLPSGQNISRTVNDEGEYVSGGLKPDVEIDLSLSSRTVIGDPKTDNQLQRAIQVIREKQGTPRLSSSTETTSARVEGIALPGVFEDGEAAARGLAA